MALLDQMISDYIRAIWIGDEQHIAWHMDPVWPNWRDHEPMLQKAYDDYEAKFDTWAKAQGDRP